MPRQAPDTSSVELGWPEVLAWRLRRQHLERRAPRTAMLDVVGDIAGLHAQVMSSAELTLWVRVEDLERGAVEHELWEERVLVKTWAMRGTLHLLPGDELPTWVGGAGSAQAAPPHAGLAARHGLTRKEADAMLAAIPRALEGRTLSRAELADAVAGLTGAGRLIEALGEEVAPVTLGGARRWMLAEHLAEVAHAAPSESLPSSVRRATEDEAERWPPSSVGTSR